MKAKSAGILCGLRAFLLRSGGDKRLLEAFYHCGAPPKAGALLPERTGLVAFSGMACLQKAGKRTGRCA